MTKVLIVLDADFRFAEPAATPDFTFTTLVSALTGAGMQVTKAHLGTDATADVQNFSFRTSVNLLDFDVLWLLGRAGRNSTDGSGTSAPYLAADERQSIARFMAAGGGVFATGDHDSIGSVMCGNLPRVRAMRCWYGANDTTSPMPNTFPRNFPVISAGRADTTQRNAGGDYGNDSTFAWFENQSDIVPQPITPTSSPAHPILRVNGADVVIYPDHMHEGNTQGVVAAYDYTQSLVINGESFAEFPAVAGSREMPRVIATGQTTGRASRQVTTGAFVGSDSAASAPKLVNTLSAYDGRAVGVGRVVTGSTWHHYIDINLSGDSSVATPALSAKVGPNAEKGHGFNDAAATMATIKQVYVNIATWLARPRPTISLVLERSTFSQDEAVAQPAFAGAILVTVDGLKPSQFPGGGITSLAPGAFLAAWAPSITPVDPTGVTIIATRVDSDDPTLPDRLQRFTFAYTVALTGTAFGFGAAFKTIEVDAALTSAASATPLTDRAWLQLVKAANPFELDLANGNQTPWLSSDLRVFAVVADGQMHHGHTMPDNANRPQALQYLQDTVAGMAPAQFEGLDMTGTGSALSPFAQTTVSHKPVYNIAIARVRLNHAAAPANVRVGFRIVPAPTTAALTYHEATPGMPTGSYKQTAGADPIPLPGTDPGSTEWVSFPCFAQARQSPPDSQTDPSNRKSIGPTTIETSTFYGALIDNNRDDAYLAPTPMGGSPVSLPTLLMGEHQCLVAQIMYAGAPIPDGAQPMTSDKLAQRNLVFSSIANPGLDASRMALHTFEIEAAPDPITDAFPPDELLLDWRSGAPEGTEVRIFIPDWDSDAVVELADRFYPRHEIRKVDDHTVALPGGGVRYVPVPRTAERHTGVIEANFPLGVRKGQRFDLAVRQIANRGRTSDEPAPKGRQITRAEAAKLLADLDHPRAGDEGRGRGDEGTLPIGAFDLGDNQVLITDLRLIDDVGDHAIVVQHPDPETVATARRDSGFWRETIGAFQLAIPVSTKHDMLAHHLRLLSVLRWRAEWLRSDSRWSRAFVRYVELMATKVAALGGDPWSVTATPDGVIELPGTHHDRDDGGTDPFDTCSDDGFDYNGFNDVGSPGVWIGKVSGLLFDQFGDFEGFVLEGHSGGSQPFFSREPAVGDLARTAWRERQVVRVITVSTSSRKVRRLIIGGPPH
jgi:hypothetical protein